MFIIFFILFIFILTVFENITLAGGAFLFIALIIIFVKAKHKNKKHLLWLLLFAVVLSFSAVAFKQYQYSKNIPNQTQHTQSNLIREARSEPQGSEYIGTGRIEDKHSIGRYIFSDTEQHKYFLYSEQDYAIGQTIYLQANFKPGLTGLNLIYKFQKLEFNLGNLSGFFNYQFNYPKRLMMRGYYGTLYEKSSLKLRPINRGFISNIKSALQNKITKTYGNTQQAGLILGMLIGDRSEIPKDKYDEFVRSGLVHIIAVSGGNILMLVIFLSAVLFFVPFYVRNFIILSFVVLYALICGMDSSVIRAALMGGLSLLALFRGREIQIRRGLSIAVILMLLINPYFLVYDVGFTLSFSAIFGLIFIQQKLPIYRNKITKIILNNYFYPTLGASMGVFPVLIFFMGEMNLLGILGNIFILPIIPFVMIYGLLSTFLYDIFARTFLLKPETRLVDYIYRVSNFLSEHGLYIKVHNQIIKYVVFVGAIILFILRHRQSKKHKTSKDKHSPVSCHKIDTKKTCQIQKNMHNKRYNNDEK